MEGECPTGWLGKVWEVGAKSMQIFGFIETKRLILWDISTKIAGKTKLAFLSITSPILKKDVQVSF